MIVWENAFLQNHGQLRHQSNLIKPYRNYAAYLKIKKLSKDDVMSFFCLTQRCSFLGTGFDDQSNFAIRGILSRWPNQNTLFILFLKNSFISPGKKSIALQVCK